MIFEDKNGKEIKLNRDELGYVAQDNTLFPDTIENNMTMFNSKLDEKVKRVVKQVEFENDLKKIPAGLKHEINLDEGNLSGGQKQKIVLARAILAGSKWLFIDEGTSAIDSKATKKILENLLDQETTIVMIAHNFNDELENLFDRKISLKNGGD
ncbi:ABC transporter ATPase component [Lactobacillus johnsonii NCC 533]|uniref:ABC transporter ATPase component n=1 Tax=Lactobacillus johnsonii (strain CNCM I-12250 / La1 / NCC 533) TaxID=257314 RepID=Q74J62_LACJO|nr:ABC transporter ATPase component [Lactobacillus johnsonii NCC 533]